MSGNPWDPTAPMGPVAPAPHQALSAAPHWPTPHPTAPPEPDTITAPLRQRPWAAALTLYLLAPVLAELLTGATPPLQFVNPMTFLTLTALYGSGALLIRETARRRGLGWGSIVLLGAAYGVLEEGLVVTSWFNPYWPDILYLHGYTRALDTNWYWALGLTAFHAIFSITLPITLVEAAFPTLAPLPWLSARARLLLALLLGAVSVAGLVGFGFVQFHAQGYHPPLVGWLLALAIAVTLAWLGTHPLARLWRRSRGEPTLPPAVNQRRAPSLPALRFAGFGFTALFSILLWSAPRPFDQPLVSMLALAATLALIAWMVSRWSHRLDWSPRRRLALLTGVALFFVALGPLSEYVIKPAGRDESGLTLVAVATLAGLIWLARSARVEEERRLAQP